MQANRNLRNSGPDVSGDREFRRSGSRYLDQHAREATIEIHVEITFLKSLSKFVDRKFS